MAEGILERLRLPRRVTEAVVSLVAEHMRFPNLPRMRAGKVRAFLGRDDFPLHLGLHEADCGGSHGDLSLAAFCRETLARFAAEPVLPPPLLTGHDLLAMGHSPGPELGRILAWVRELQLDGEVGDREEAVRRVRDRFPPPTRGA
jgi:poly(A) polymerase